eukprot:31376-Pelagococcus_subviridis.AAC.16
MERTRRAREDGRRTARLSIQPPLTAARRSIQTSARPGVSETRRDRSIRFVAAPLPKVALKFCRHRRSAPLPHALSLDATEDALRFARDSERRSRASFSLSASTLWYACASDLDFSIFAALIERSLRLRWRDCAGEQLANLRRALGPAKTRLFVVRETGKRAGALLDDHEVEHGDVLGHDAAADSLTPALTLPAAVTQEPGRALLHEEEHALRGEDTLLHAEPLLVVAAHDLEDVPFELLAEALAVDLRGDALVVKDAQLAVIVDFNLLLAVDSKRGGGGERVSEVRGEVLDEFVSFVRSRRQSRAVAGKDDVRWPAGVGRHARAMTTTGRGARDAC